jgi:hypothetical protein
MALENDLSFVTSQYESDIEIEDRKKGLQREKTKTEKDVFGLKNVD